MFDPGTAVAASLIGGGVSSYYGSRAAKKGADAAAAASRDAARINAETQRYMYDTSRADMAPWMTAGKGSLNILADLYGIPREMGTEEVANPEYEAWLAKNSGPEPPRTITMKATSLYGGKGGGRGQVVTNPAYTAWAAAQKKAPPKMISRPTYGNEAIDINEFMARDPGVRVRSEAANKALERSGLRKGNIFSGNFARELSTLNQDLGSQEFGNIINRLSGLAGTGQAATGTIGGYGMNAAGNIGQGYLTAGRTAAEAAMAGGNARASMYGDIADYGTNALNNYMYYDYLKRKPAA